MGLLDKIRSRWRRLSLWRNAVKLASKGYCEKSLELLAEYEATGPVHSKHLLLGAYNRLKACDYTGCDFTLRRVLEMLPSDETINPDEEAYLRVYIKHMYLVLEHYSALMGPEFEFPTDISTKNVQSRLLNLFPLPTQ